jgi:uncharacterized membrane protein
MRGFAVLCMVVHHTFDSFLATGLKDSAWARGFRFMGGMAAPAFLFLAGLAVALTLEKAALRGSSTTRASVLSGVRRGLGIVALAYVFRVQEWALAWPWSPATDILRVDVLNTIGVSIVAVALLWGTRSRVVFAGACGIVIAVTPVLWSLDLGHSLAARYVAGRPPATLFPIFPWLGYALAGGALGLVWARTPREQEGRLLLTLSVGGLAAWLVAGALDPGPHDFLWWNTAPACFAERLASNVWILTLLWGVERLFPRAWADPLLQLGRHSLIVYWIHIELVYGRWFWRSRGVLPLAKAWLAFACVLGLMIVIAYAMDVRRRVPARVVAPA